MQAALESYDPTFRPWPVARYDPRYVSAYSFSSRQAMFAVVGDFNGDHRPDVMVDGHTRTSVARVALLSDRSGVYRVVELERGPLRPGVADHTGTVKVYLEYVAPGRIESPVCDTACVLDLRTDAVHVIYDEEAAEILYYRGGQFHRFATGD